MRNLFQRLPYNSETYFEINDTPTEARYWDVNTYMLANLYDMLNAVDWHIIASNSKHPPKPPKPMKRPDLKKKPKVWPGKTVVVKE